VTSTRPLIAVVDDDVSVRRALARLLQAAGYHAETFADAEAFLAYPASHPPRASSSMCGCPACRVANFTTT
jgi:FixJ family two-component response regulator